MYETSNCLIFRFTYLVDRCSSEADCHENAVCYKMRSGRKRCKCRRGFEGDGVNSCDGKYTRTHTHAFMNATAWANRVGPDQTFQEETH